METAYCGVDFGTTNSTVGLCRPGETPRLIALEGEHRTIPTALFYSLEDGKTYFGRSAVFEYMDGAEGRFMRALNSAMARCSRAAMICLSSPGLIRRVSPTYRK